MIRSYLRKLRTFTARTRRDTRGVAAVEFALIIPIMFFLFVGAIEFSHALTVDRRVSQVASSTADLVSRTDRVTTAQLDDIMNIIQALFNPYDFAPLKLAVVSVKAAPDDETQTTVDWAYAHNGGTVYAAGTPYPIPAGLMSKGSSVIVGEVVYNYQPFIFSYFMKSSFEMNEKFYLSPRTKSCVSLNDTNCVTGQPF